MNALEEELDNAPGWTEEWVQDMTEVYERRPRRRYPEIPRGSGDPGRKRGTGRANRLCLAPNNAKSPRLIARAPFSICSTVELRTFLKSRNLCLSLLRPLRINDR